MDRRTAAVAVACGLVGAGGLALVWAEEPSGPQVTMTDQLVFQPGTVQVKAGGTVTWRNDSVLTHTVTADPKLALDPQNSVQLPQGAQPFNSGELGPGATWSHTFDVPGTYKYFCIPHETAGMTGNVEVTK